MKVKDNNILFYLPGGIYRCGPTSRRPFLWNTHCNFTKVKLLTPNEVAVDGAVRWHQHVSGKTNTRRRQNLSFPDQRATLLRSHSSVYLSWKHRDQFLLICSSARFGPFTRRCRILGLCPMLQVGSLNPGLHPALSEIWSPNQTACVSSSWTPEKLLSGCGCREIIVGLKLGTGWGLERECGIFQCCVISMFYCFPSPNGWLQDSGKSPERWTLTVSLALGTHSLLKPRTVGLSELDPCIRVTKERRLSSSLLLVKTEIPQTWSLSKSPSVSETLYK